MDWASKWDRVESNMYTCRMGEIIVSYLCESMTTVMLLDLSVNLGL